MRILTLLMLKVLLLLALVASALLALVLSQRGLSTDGVWLELPTWFPRDVAQVAGSAIPALPWGCLVTAVAVWTLYAVSAVRVRREYPREV